MAGALFIPLKTVYDNSGIKKANKDIATAAKSMKGLLAGVGVGIGFSAITSSLFQAGKMAVEDSKSQALLAQQLRNTANATKEQISGVEDFISKTQLQTSVLDDELRPAMASLLRATGNVTSAQQLLSLATNVSAATGKDLQSVSLALGKAVSGQTTALFRLIPGLKGSKDWMAQLQKETAGAAKAAANADPLLRLKIIFDELQEAIGRALIPYLQKLADYFASPEGQAKLNDFASNVGDIATAIIDLADALKLSGILDDLATLVDRAAAIAKLDFGKIGQQDANAGMKQYVDLYLTNRKAYDEKIAFLKRAKNSAAIVAEIEAYVKRNVPSTGGGSTTLDQFINAGGIIKSTTDTYTGFIRQQGNSKKVVDAATKAQKDYAAAIARINDVIDKQVKAYWDAVDAAEQFFATTKEVTAGFVALFKVTPQMGEFEQAVVTGFEDIYNTIKSALKDSLILPKAATALTTFANTSVAAMQAIAKQRDVLAGKIDVARTITAGVTGLANITSMLDTVTESVTSSVRTMANGIETIITRTTDVTTSGGLVDNFQKLVDKTKKFAQNLIDLKKLGLNKNLFAQLVNAGADAGGATADAIVQGGSDTIVALNDLYRQLDVTAGEIAQNTTDVMYEVGQQIISNGFIEGLVSQADALTRTAQALAQSFADAFNKQMAGALQANLPSLPSVPSVAMSSAGISGGLAAQLNAMGFFKSGVATSNGLNQINAPASVINLYLSAQGTGITGSQLAQQMIAEIKKYERANGAVWQAAN